MDQLTCNKNKNKTKLIIHSLTKKKRKKEKVAAHKGRPSFCYFNIAKNSHYLDAHTFTPTHLHPLLSLAIHHFFLP